MFFIVVFVMCTWRNTDSPMTTMLSYQDISISRFWSVCSCLWNSAVIYKLIFCRHLFMPVSLLLLLLLLLWDCCSWQQWWWCGFFSLLVLCNNWYELLLYLIQLEFLANIFALGQAEQFCMLFCMASCCTILNCTTVHSRQLTWLNLA